MVDKGPAASNLSEGIPIWVAHDGGPRRREAAHVGEVRITACMEIPKTMVTGIVCSHGTIRAWKQPE
jgi:hypothetical protein